MQFVTGGGLRVDYLITHDNQAYVEQIGGNALYAAVGAALWSDEVGLWARLGENYPETWLDQLRPYPINTTGLVPLSGKQDHRTFFAYTPDGRREDTNPAYHFARIGQPLPDELRDYLHSTPGQDDPDRFEPLALRPEDWTEPFTGVTAVHISPLALATHKTVPSFLKAQGINQITLDPGERYMVPERETHVQEIMPSLDAFLPSSKEVRSLFGSGISLWEAAEQFCQWGAQLAIIKNGAAGLWLLEGVNGRRSRLPAYHAPNDPRVIDVTGAGDSFCGGFMVGLAQTGDPIQAAQLGMISASLVIEGYGALYALKRGKTEAQQRLQEMQDTGLRS